MTSEPVPKPAIPKPTVQMAATQNVNHLLNFTLPPRQQRPVAYQRRGRKPSTQYGVWNKERYVNGQYRFVMNPTGDYTVHFADPDIFFEWLDILQVIIPRSPILALLPSSGNSGEDEGNTICPICLSVPTAPRMTKCGHVFCFPCILHYLSTSENKWARCPICFDSVNEKQLKAVKWFDTPMVGEESTGQEPSPSSSAREPFSREGFIMQMRLIERPQITTLALPRSPTWPSDLLPPHQAPFHFLPDVFSFSRFMLATPAYLIANLSRDLDELATERQILLDANDDLGVYFIDRAEDRVRNQIEEATALETSGLMEQIERIHREKQEIEERVAFNKSRLGLFGDVRPMSSEGPQEFLALKAGNGLSAPRSMNNISVKTKSISTRTGPKQRRNVNPPPPSTSTYYYYQAASGLPLFLHPLDIRILLAHFNSYSSFPDTITIRVEAFTEGSVNDDLRKRCKYLSHMPEGADVVFIEADLEGVVGAEGLKNFDGALKMRTARRKEKDRKDDRARLKAEEREREKEQSRWRSFAYANSSTVIHRPSEEDVSPVLDEAVSVIPPVPPVTSGAWGSRSFASALHSSPASTNGRTQQQPRRQEPDEWDIDAAWHELERDAGARKKRGNRLVVLGGGLGGSRRR